MIFSVRSWADKRAETIGKRIDYMRARAEMDVLTKEFLKKLTWAKNKKLISVRELHVMRYRLRDNQTLDYVARKMDVTRERIRMVEESVIAKLIEL